MSTTIPAREVRTRRRSWVPNQHGAWAMLALPIIVGVAMAVQLGTFSWWLLPLAIAWLAGYCAFFFASLWLKSGGRRGALQTGVYAGAAAALALIGLIAEPAMFWWAPVFAPLLGIGLWLAHRRQDRSVASGAVTVVAASLATPVLAGALVSAVGGGPWWAAGWQAAYFFGTVLYVKTMIRERGHRQWVVASVGYHVACLAMALLVGGAALAAFFALALLRSAVVPLNWPMRGRPLRPGGVGVGELLLSVLLLSVLLLGASA